MSSAIAQLGMAMLFAAAAIVAFHLFAEGMDRLEAFLRSLADDDEDKRP